MRARVLTRFGTAIPLQRGLRERTHGGARSENARAPVSVRQSKHEAWRLHLPTPDLDRYQRQPLCRGGSGRTTRAALRIQGPIGDATAKRADRCAARAASPRAAIGTRAGSPHEWLPESPVARPETGDSFG